MYHQNSYDAQLQAIVKNEDRVAAFVDLVCLYIDGNDELRKGIREDWFPKNLWELPNIFRLACSKNEYGSSLKRINAQLVYFSFQEFSKDNYREDLIAAAVIYQSCILIGLNPDAIFEKVASISTPMAKDFLIDFINRNEQDKSLSAFYLTVKENSDGEFEIKPSWFAI
jgi:hypothetical protein